MGKPDVIFGGSTEAALEGVSADKLRLDQLALALRNLGPNHFLMPLFTAIICVMFYRWVPVARLEAWFVLLTASVVPLGLISHRFRKRQPEASEAKRWILRATLAYGLFALSWASMAVFLWTPSDDLNHLLIILGNQGYFYLQESIQPRLLNLPSKQLTIWI